MRDVIWREDADVSQSLSVRFSSASDGQPNQLKTTCQCAIGQQMPLNRDSAWKSFKLANRGHSIQQIIDRTPVSVLIVYCCENSKSKQVEMIDLNLFN